MFYAHLNMKSVLHVHTFCSFIKNKPTIDNLLNNNPLEGGIRLTVCTVLDVVIVFLVRNPNPSTKHVKEYR